MTRRLPQLRLRLVDAVAAAALAVLAMKAISFLAPDAPKSTGSGQAGVVAGEQLPSFFRAVANARSNYAAPDVTMTGAVPAKAPEAKKDPEKKDAAPAEASPKPAAFEVAPQQPSAAERALLERLGERREEIQQKGRDLEMRERLLENAERRLESRLNELRSLEEKAGEAAKRGDSEEAARKNLVTMYEIMKPKEAARVFDRLSHDVLVPVVTQMNPRKMAEILAAMSPEAAEKLTVALATRHRNAPDPRAPAVAGILPANELPAIEPPGQSR
jgi:flagellar motility protein MotE (MotC chaperone)